LLAVVENGWCIRQAAVSGHSYPTGSDSQWDAGAWRNSAMGMPWPPTRSLAVGWWLRCIGFTQDNELICWGLLSKLETGGWLRPLFVVYGHQPCPPIAGHRGIGV